jgi:hypothetical protein
VRGNQARLRLVDHGDRDEAAAHGVGTVVAGKKLRPTGTAGDTTGAI